jgi:signal transduction histidine kinase
VTPPEAGLWDQVETLHAISAKLAMLQDPEDIANRVVEAALDLMGASIAFIALVDDAKSDRRVFSSAREPSPQLTHDQIDTLASGTGPGTIPTDDFYAQTLQAGGRNVGTLGAVGVGDLSTARRQAFDILANEAAAALEIARLLKARDVLVKNASQAVDKARRRIASELHDDALQKLTAAELQLERVSDATDEADMASVGDAKSLLQQAEDALRRLMFEMRPHMLDAPGGFDTSIRDRVTMMRSLTGIEAELDLDLPDQVPDDLKSTVFRQVAEALTNVEKHASATRVQVVVKVLDGGIHGLVADDGRGFVVAERERLPGHLGLIALNERAMVAGGWCTIESEPGLGTRVEFWVPTPA